MNGSLVVFNSRVLTPDGLVETDLAVQGGRISDQIPVRPDMTVDGSGLLAAPGLIDIQVNGAFGLDFTADPGSIWKVGERMPATGVTAFLPTIISSPAAQRTEALRVIAEGPPPGYRGARVLGLHLEGPMLAPGRRGTHQPAHLRPPSTDLVDGWAKRNGVRLVTLAPELAGAEPVIRALIHRDVVVAAGHSQATYEEGTAALRAGVTHGTHLFNGMPPMVPREPGLVGALLDDQDASVGIIVDGIHLHAATVRFVRRNKPADSVVLITDAMAGMGAGPGEYVLHDLAITVDETTARNVHGGLAGSILTLDQAVRNYMAFTGCATPEAWAAASANPARAIGEPDRGQIKIGAFADVVLLDDELAVQATIIEGELVHSVAGLADRGTD